RVGSATRRPRKSPACPVSGRTRAELHQKWEMLPQQLLTLPFLTSFPSRGLDWCREGESNPQGTKYRRILSPLRLPVPPSRLAEKSSLVDDLLVCNFSPGACLEAFLRCRPGSCSCNLQQWVC